MSETNEPWVIDLMAELRNPVVGAVIAVEWWQHRGASIEITVDQLDERGWEMLRSLAGSEAVEITRKHAGGKVLVIGALELKDIPVAAGDRASLLFGVPVYRVSDQPSPWVGATEGFDFSLPAPPETDGRT